MEGQEGEEREGRGKGRGRRREGKGKYPGYGPAAMHDDRSEL